MVAMKIKNQKLHSKMKKKTNLIKFTPETEKMAGRSVILKKLCELETELAVVIRAPLDPTFSGTRLQIPFDEINQKFVFLGNLIQQEMASGQPRVSDELLEIRRRFKALQTGFLRWNESRHSVCSDCTHNLLRGEDGELSGELKLLRDSPADEIVVSKRDASTQVVPYDDDDFESSSDSTSSLGEFSGVEKKSEKFLNSVEKKKNLIKEEAGAAVTEGHLWGKMAKYGGAFGCGMIVGAVFMAKLFFISYSSVDFIQYEALLLPPT
ncbi:hypothetical protein CASFOL_010387 [Castilleja foliolosa]|uniref:DUF7610 domain-containing protein n=1 Tax=Castilleja foliolosa TaxID=1961234 RepID=A0ABD3DSZ7_9LAMI